MRIYIVGGFCRDTLLGLQPKDRDFVVVGSSPVEMLSLGMKTVGKDFPVFLNEQGEEFALARTERKVGVGYSGFDTDWEGVPLEEDLYRRDLSCNAIAREVDVKEILNNNEVKFVGDYIDPYNGIQDIEDKILRNTSEAFSEDPLRVLRVARFLARFGCEWKIAEATLAIMDQVYHSGGLKELTPERVFKEMQKALSDKTPSLFFTTLYRYGIFDEIDMLYGVPQRTQHHPEIEDKLERLCVK